jgi:hypothetical protein
MRCWTASPLQPPGLTRGPGRPPAGKTKFCHRTSRMSTRGRGPAGGSFRWWALPGPPLLSRIVQEVQQPGWQLQAIHRPQPVKRPGRGDHPCGEAVVRNLQVQRALEKGQDRGVELAAGEELEARAEGAVVDDLFTGLSRWFTARVAGLGRAPSASCFGHGSVGS